MPLWSEKVVKNIYMLRMMEANNELDFFLIIMLYLIIVKN